MTDTPPAYPAPAGQGACTGAEPPGAHPATPAYPASQGDPAGSGYPGTIPYLPGPAYPASPGYPGYAGYVGYPQYPGYQAGGWSAGTPAPGSVPLRPLGLGEILGGAFSLVRQNPKATLGLTASIVTALAASLALILLIASQTAPWVDLLAVPAGLALSGLQLGGLTAAMGRGLLGRRLGIRDAIRASHAGRVVVALLVLGTGFLACWWALIATLKGWGALIALLLTAWLIVMVSLTIPVVVLEGRWPFPALARSWRLVLGSYWRLLGIYLLTYLLTMVLSFVISFPIEIGGGLAGAAGGAAGAGHAGAFLAAGVFVIGEIVVFSLTATIQAGVLVLVYADMRMRKEGMDLVLQQAAYAGRLSGEEFATTTPGSAYTGGVRPAGPPAV
jgi:hypothetical protein